MTRTPAVCRYTTRLTELANREHGNRQALAQDAVYDTTARVNLTSNQSFLSLVSEGRRSRKPCPFARIGDSVGARMLQRR
jgi:hypothetical protein